MKKSREFDNVLDECLERLLVKGETIEQCLQGFPEHVDELKPLLETALAAKRASAIQPRPEFRERARYQLYSALQEVERKNSRLFFGWQSRWAMVVAVVLALLLAGGGTVAAASGSMPDNPLYPVKLATEQVQLVLTPSALGKAELYAKLADKRVAEIAYMAEKGKPQQVEQTAQRLSAYLDRIAVLSSPQEVTVAMAPVLREAQVAQESLEAGEAPPVEEAPLLSEQAKEGKGPPFKAERRAKLKETVMHYAANHTARLRAALETAPPSARPALLRAIAVSEAGYEKALESLD